MFCYSSKFLKYCEYVERTLKSFGILEGGRIRKVYNKSSNCYGYRYRSLHYVELLPIYRQWYPNNKKIVPKTVKLTPSTIRQWYIGDGTLNNHDSRSSIRLCTDSFTISDVKCLVKQLINLGFEVTRQLSTNRIHISVYSTKEFLKYIGSCPVKCYRYKWNYQDNRKKGILLYV
jgi:hypothetical protein